MLAVFWAKIYDEMKFPRLCDTSVMLLIALAHIDSKHVTVLDIGTTASGNPVFQDE